MDPIRINITIPYISQLQEASLQLGIPIYCVGGYVRDVILKRKTKDIDILVIGDGVEFAKKFASILGKSASLATFKTFGTAQVKYKDVEFEFVGARKESYQKDSRNPKVSPGTLEDDLSRRDFTINALAVSLQPENFGELIDLFEGYFDIQDIIIKTPLEPSATFSDDPLRMLRAARFASQLGFTIDSETFEGIAKNAHRIKIITQERITTELNKIIESPLPSLGFTVLYHSGLLAHIFPEFQKLAGVKTIDNKAHKDNFFHTLEVLDNVARAGADLWLRWAAILHDIGKPATQRFDEKQGWTFHGHEVVGAKMVKKIFTKFKLPLGEELRYVEKLVKLHLRPIALTKEVTDTAIRRLIVDAGEDLDDLIKLCKADVTSKNLEKKSKYIKRFDMVMQKVKDVEEKDALRNWKNPITGEYIMEKYGIPPSQTIGLIKEEIKEAIMEGIIPNTFEDAAEYLEKNIGKYKS